MTRRLFLLLAALLLTLSPFLAAEPITGVPPYGSVDTDGLGAINRQNLNVNFAIPVVRSPGRGEGLHHDLVYDSLIYKRSGSSWAPVRDEAGTATYGWKLDKVVGFTRWTQTTEFCTDGNLWVQHYSNWNYTDTDGRLISFALDFYNYFSPTCTLPTGPRTGYSTDGAGYYLDATNPAVWKIYRPDGTIIPATLTAIPDTNGNYISRAVVGGEVRWIDTAGRVALKIVNNATNKEFKILDTNGAYRTLTVTYTTKDVRTNFGCPGVAEYQASAVTLPAAILLPNGTRYDFTYETTPGFPAKTTGRLLRVTLPYGNSGRGFYEFSYPTQSGQNGGIDCSSGDVRDLTKNVDSTGDGTTDSTWRFVRTKNGQNEWETLVTYPRLPYDTVANESWHLFNTSGQIKEERLYQGSKATGTLLSSLATAHVGGTSAPSSELVTLGDGSQARVVYSYDSYGLLTKIKEYDYGATAPATTPFRTTVYSWDRTIPYVSRNLITLLTQAVVRAGDETGPIVSRTDYAYDGTVDRNADGTADNPCITGAAQHDDANYSCAFQYRGNLRKITRYQTPATGGGPIVTEFTFDNLGNLRAADDDDAKLSQWTYSAATQWSFPDAEISGADPTTQLTRSVLYNSFLGVPTSFTDESCATTTMQYDIHGRITLLTRPDGAQVTFVHDDAARTVRATYPLQGFDTLRRELVLDPLGRVARAVESKGSGGIVSQVDFQYDPLGRTLRHSVPYLGAGAPYWNETRVDAAGRPVLVIPPDGTATWNNHRYVYTGATVTITDPALKQIRQRYDSAGRLIAVVEPDASTGALTQETNYTYDALDALTTVTQGAQLRTFVRDGLGRVTTAQSAEATGSVSYQYDRYSQVTQRVDARGVITTYQYDGLNRLTRTSYNVGSSGVSATADVVRTYGGSCAAHDRGRLVSMVDGSGSESYSYDLLGRRTQFQRVAGGTTYTIGYTYNTAGQVTSMTLPSGRTLATQYDAAGRAVRYYDSQTGYNYVDGATYNASGRPLGWVHGNGVVANLAYLPERQLLSSVTYQRASTSLFSLAYDYFDSAVPNEGNNGAIRRAADSVDSGRTLRYAYDPLKRLATAATTGSAAYPAWGLMWTYDRYGNRTAQTATTGAPPSNVLSINTTNNRISLPGYSFDAHGNEIAAPSRSAQYDAANNLVSATVNGTTATYAYNGNGYRVSSTVGGATTVQLRDGSQLLAEYSGGTLAREYLYFGGRLVATYDGGALRYYLRDGASVRVVTDGAGTTVGSQAHYPFGESWYDAGTTSKWKFTSFERDLVTTDDHAIFRYLSPQSGRFRSPDRLAGSLERPQTLNRYAYAVNDPVNQVDPLGLSVTCTPTGKKDADGDEIILCIGDPPHRVTAPINTLGGAGGGGVAGCRTGKGGTGCLDDRFLFELDLFELDNDVPPRADTVFPPDPCPECPPTCTQYMIDYLLSAFVPDGFEMDTVIEGGATAVEQYYEISVENHILKRGLTVPLRSSIVRRLTARAALSRAVGATATLIEANITIYFDAIPEGIRAQSEGRCQ